MNLFTEMDRITKAYIDMNIPKTQTDPECLTIQGEKERESAQEVADAMKEEKARDYFNDQTMLSEGLGEASFSLEVQQLFVIANDFYQKKEKGQDIDYMEYASVSTKLMNAILKEMNEYFMGVAE